MLTHNSEVFEVLLIKVGEKNLHFLSKREHKICETENINVFVRMLIQYCRQKLETIIFEEIHSSKTVVHL